MKKYSIIATLNLEDLELNEPLNEGQIIIEHFLYADNTINAQLKFQSFYNGWSRIWSQKFLLESFSISIQEMNLFEKETEHEDTVRQMKSEQLKLMKIYNDKCYQKIYGSAAYEAFVTIPISLQKRLKSLAPWQLKECYERAQASSFLIIREQAFCDMTIFNSRLLIDIGDAFQNYRGQNEFLIKAEVISDLLLYERWLNTINFLVAQQYINKPKISIEDFSLKQIISKLINKNVHKI